MQASATAKFVRISPRKTRLLADLIRGKNVKDAETQLRMSAKGSRMALMKLLKSALANAGAKKMDEAKLRVKSVTVDSGPVLKRWRPRAFGRAFQIKKGTSHITIILSEKEK